MKKFVVLRDVMNMFPMSSYVEVVADNNTLLYVMKAGSAERVLTDEQLQRRVMAINTSAKTDCSFKVRVGDIVF